MWSSTISIKTSTNCQLHELKKICHHKNKKSDNFLNESFEIKRKQTESLTYTVRSSLQVIKQILGSPFLKINLMQSLA